MMKECIEDVDTVKLPVLRSKATVKLPVVRYYENVFEPLMKLPTKSRQREARKEGKS